MRPRSGLLGQWDRFVGPGASATENLGTLTCGVLGAVVASRVSASRPVDSAARLLLSALALDLWGGAWCNNTPSCARWYEREGQGAHQHIVFAAAHVHPFVVAWLSRESPSRTAWWAWGCGHYGYLLLATMVVPHQDGAPRRVTGILATAGGLLLDRRLGPSSSAPWFAPVYYVKLLTAHAAGAALAPGRRWREPGM